MIGRKHFAIFFGVCLSLLTPDAARAACSGANPTCSGPGASIGPLATNLVYTKANPYPSVITVPGSVAGTVTSVSVTLHGFAADGSNGLTTQGLGLLLMSPDGRQFEFLRDAGNGNQTLTNVTLGIADGNATAAPNQSGTWGATTGTINIHPTSYSDSTSPTNYPSPGPGNPANTAAPAGSGTFANVFTGALAAGNWSLYMVDHRLADAVSFTSWDLTLAASASLTSTNTAVISNRNPSFTSGANSSVTLAATVTTSGGGQPTGTVNFKDAITGTSTTISGCGAVALVGSVANTSTASCTATFAAEGNHPITAFYTASGNFANSNNNTAFNQLVKNHSTLTTGNYCNTGSIAIPGIAANQAIYPSVINVGTDTTGFANTVNNLTITLKGLSGASGLGTVQMLLVSPGGAHALDFLSHAGNTISQPSVNVTFADNNSAAPQNAAFTSSTYQATSYSNSDTFLPSPPSPAPAVPGSFSVAQPGGTFTLQQAFSGAPTDGDWLLYIFDNGGSGSSASLAQGWCLNVTANTGTPTTTTIGSGLNPSKTGNSVTFTATVRNTINNALITTGAVTFTENGVQVAGGPAGPVTVVNGVASFTTSSLPEGDHNITATYHDASSVNNDSFGHVIQRVDNITNPVTVNGVTVTYCNTGVITIPAGATLPNNIGPARPNPSNIFVSGLFGTINNVTLTLANYHFPFPTELASLLVGPSATTADTLDFFSNAGGASPVGPGNVIFKDSAPALVPSNSSPVFGFNKPTSYAGTQVYTASPSGFYTLPGTLQLAAPAGASTFSIYQNENGNGTWSLYFDQTAHTNGGGIDNGWCMAFTENPPVISGSKSNGGLHFVQGQQNAHFTVTVHNAGPGAAGGVSAVTVSDTLAADLTPAATPGSGTDWNCSAVGQVITCTNNDFIPAGSDFPTLTLNVNVAPAAGASVSNTATLSGGGSVGGVSAGPISTIIDPAPVLSVSKTHVGTFTQGSTGEWDVTVNNTKAGSVTAGTTMLVDTLPAGYTLSSFSSAGNVWTCGSLTQTVTCTATSGITGGNSFATLQLFVNIPAASPTSVTNNVSVFGGGDVIHTNSGNAATGSDQVTVIQVPTQMAVNAGTPQSAIVGSAFATALSVIIKDAGNVVVPGVSVTFTAPAQTGPSGTFANTTGTTSVNTNVGGIATATTFTANTHVGGPYNVVASAPGLTSVNFALTNKSAPTLTPATLPGGSVGSPYSKTLTASGGTPPYSTPSVAGGSAPPGTTFSPGTASFSFTPAAATTYSFSLTMNDSGGGSTTQGYSIVILAPASAVATAGTPQSAPVNTVFATPFQVHVANASNAPVEGAQVTFTAPASGPSGSFSGSNVVFTDAAGNATAPAFQANTVAGSYNVTASVSGIASPSFSLTNQPGAPASIVSSAGTPQSATVGTAFSTALQALVRDAFSNPVPGVLVTFTAPGSGASGTFANATGTTQATTVANGTATATTFTANGTAGSYAVTASTGVLTPANFSLTNTSAGGGQTDVSNQVSVTGTGFVYSRVTQQFVGTMTITNTSGQAITGPISVVMTNLPNGVTLANATGTNNNSPYIRVINAGSLNAGQSAQVQLRFSNPSAAAITFVPVTYSGL